MAVLVPVAYLLGTFPSAELVARAAGVDVRAAGSGNPGASNVARLLGWRAGALVLLADFAKGAVAAGAGLALDGRRGAYVLGAAAIVGHVFPVTRRFRGGKGVATGGGVLLVVFPLVLLAAAAVWLLLARVAHRASIASIAAAVLVPAGVVVGGGTVGDLAAVGALAALVLVRHAPNLRRLVRGEELGLRADPDGGPRPER